MALKTYSFQRWINILTFAATIIINGLAGSARLIGGKTTAEVSDSFPTLITPAGYVFSIWGVIYVLLGVFMVYQALPSQKNNRFQEKVGWLFALSNLLNIFWIFLWHFGQLVLSVILMTLIFLDLILIYLRLQTVKTGVSTLEKIAVHLPFSVYLGWITIASIANFAAMLVSVRWDGFGISSEIWAVLIIIVATCVTVLVLATKRDIPYSLVVVWALLGIAVAQGKTQIVVVTSEFCTFLIILTIAIIIFSKKLRKSP
ncbi:tryptophan-rich sensory protein [Candidatus Bathyarchaeota archaeon]|nr:tryptophan-rich sensory protein [Candidatus Bathyarchaeota archaeon]